MSAFLLFPMSFSMSAPPSSMNVARTTSKPRIGGDAILGTFGTNVVIKHARSFRGCCWPACWVRWAAVNSPRLFFGQACLRRLDYSDSAPPSQDMLEPRPDEDALTRAGLVLGFGLAVFISISCYLMMPLSVKRPRCQSGADEQMVCAFHLL